MKRFVLVSAWLFARLSLATPEPVLFPVPPEDAERGPGWLDETLMVDYATPSDQSAVQAWASTNRNVVVWGGTSQLGFSWLSDASEYGPYLAMDAEMLKRYAARKIHAAHALTVLGVRLFQSNVLDQSVACFEQVAQIDPDNERAAELYSAIAIKAWDLAKARAVVRKLLDRFPANDLIRFNLACVYALNGDKDFAFNQLLFLAKTGWPDLMYHMADPDIMTLRADPRFLSLEKGLFQQNRDKAIDTYRASMFAPNM